MGGPLLGYILDGVVMFQEFLYDSQWAHRFKRVATGRYVDDLIMLSHTI